MSKPFIELVPHMNDKHRMTREQIADVVKSVECPVVVEQPEAVHA